MIAPMAAELTEAMVPSQTIGPLYGFSLLFAGSESTVDPSVEGAVRILGGVYDGNGEPVQYPECLVEVWEGEQYARTRTDENGQWKVVMRKPPSRLLLGGRVQAPHLNVTIFARGLLKQAQTLIYFPDEEEANAADPIMELVEAELRGRLVASEDAGELRYDIHLQGSSESVFFDY